MVRQIKTTRGNRYRGPTEGRGKVKVEQVDNSTARAK